MLEQYKNLTVEERIQKCIEEFPEIDNNYLPDIYILQKCIKDGEPYGKYHNIKTGEVSETVQTEGVVNPGSWNKNQGLVYVRLYKDYDILETSVVQFDSHRDKRGGIRPVTFVNARVFADAVSKTGYVYGRGMNGVALRLYNPKDSQGVYHHLPNYDHHGFYNTYPTNYEQYINATWHLLLSNDTYVIPILKEFYKIAGIEEDSYWRLGAFINPKQKKISPKTQQRTNELLALTKEYTAEDLKQLKQKYPLAKLKIKPIKAEDKRTYAEMNSYAKYILQSEKLTDDIGLIRVLDSGVEMKWIRNQKKEGWYDGHYELTQFAPAERFRLYISPKEVIEVENTNEWWHHHKEDDVYTPKWERTTYIKANTLALYPVKIENVEELYKCQQRVGYLKSVIQPMIDDIPDITVYTGIAHCLRHPIVEQLAKAGYPHIAKYIIHDGQVNDALKDLFGKSKYDSKTLNIYQKLKINKEQLKYIEDHMEDKRYYYSSNDEAIAVRLIKDTLGLEDLSSLTMDDFKFDMLKAQIIDRSCYRWGVEEGKRYLELAPRDMKEDETACQKLVDKVIRIAVKENPDNPRGVVTIYRDGLEMYNGLKGTEYQYDYDFSTIKGKSDIVRFHDACLALNNAKCAEEQRLRELKEEEKNKELEKKMAKIQKQRKEDFEYEDNDFLIRIPEHLSEITREGATLHHCVGGYVTNHAQGYTNIMFLRKKSEPDKQFYTVEVDNNKTVVQIHGANNKWLGCDPEAIPFIKRWLRDKKISCTKEIYLSKATGYWSSGKDLAPDPEI